MSIHTVSETLAVIVMRPTINARSSSTGLLLLVMGSLAMAQNPPRPPSPDTLYVLGPDSKPQPGVPEGRIREFMMTDSKTYPGVSHRWWLYIPANYDGRAALPLMVFMDGGGYVRREGSWRTPVVLDNLIAKHEIPMMA